MKFEARFKIELEQINSDNQDAFEAEFNGLNYHASLRSFKFRAQKLDFSKEEALLFDMLCDIKKDLLELKDLKASEYIPLKITTFSSKVDYENIELSEDVLMQDQSYYARMVLQDCTIAVFLKALSSNCAQISKIKRYDEESFNHYVADIQRHLIYQKKDLDATRFDN